MPPLEPLTEQQPLPVDAPLQRQRVLVAEDDPLYRRALERLLERASYEVDTVDNGVEALRASLKSDAPRLLILDWVMPGMPGPEVCRALRHNATGERYQYILLLTAKDAKADTVTGLEAGADDYLTKPFDSQELLARLRVGTRILELQDKLLCAKKEMEYLATHDPMTGLWNRLAWNRLLVAEFERAHRNADGLAVLMIDIDHFKLVNDNFGHAAGDAVVHNMGEMLRSLVRTYDLVGRYGGEEFIVVAQQSSEASTYEYADRIRTALSESTVNFGNSSIAITVSIGAAFGSNLAACTPDAMVRSADQALYAAKARGRNCVVVDIINSCGPVPAGGPPAALELR
jgi:diguanylate cyclase (GGDEF)-like protein